MAKSKRRHSRPLRVLLGLLLVGVASVSVLGIAAVALLYRQIEESLPPIDTVVDYRPPVTTQIFADDGTVIGEFFAERRYLVPLQRIPKHVREAFIAAEDASFYEHRGIDPTGILRAFLNNVAAGGKVQGGSTITQQVVKSLLLTPTKSYERKVKEIILSLRLERQLPKDEILALYLNHIYLGAGAHGVAAAAQQYFAKDITEIDLAEAALLAGLPQAPSRYSPFRNWHQAKARQRYVINRMYEVGMITQDTRDAALQQPLSLAARQGSYIEAPYFVEHVRRDLEEQYGRATLYELGLRVHTTVNVEMQRAAEEALRDGLRELAARNGEYRSIFRRLDPAGQEIYLRQQRALYGGELELSAGYDALVTNVTDQRARVQVGSSSGELILPTGDKDFVPLQLNDVVRVRLVEKDGDELQFELDPTPLVEGALIALDPTTGEVKAMVGGYDFDRSQFNRAVQAERQPGSAFKPLVYAAAMDSRFTPASIIVDEPIFYNDNGEVWSPQNFEKKYFGPTSLREALTHSRNVVTVKLADAMGIGYLVDYLQRFGFHRKLARNLSIALGSAEVTPLEIGVAYSALANQGLRPDPLFVRSITDADGNPLETNAPHLEQAIPPETAYLVTSILQDVVRSGTGRRAQGLGRPTAGKTGTTNDLHDAWFVGYTPELLCVVWVGFDNKVPLGRFETGGRVSAPIWKAFMTKALAKLPQGEFAVPDGLTCIQIDPVSGMRALPGSPSRLECFRKGTEPRMGSLPAVQLIHQDESDRPSTLEFLRNDF
jgi:penicillin-binding protein 1A